MSDSDQTTESVSLVKHKIDLYAAGDNISWRKIPDALFELCARFGCLPNEQLVALHLARHTARTLHYPSFTIKRTQLALETGLSERTITGAIRTLALLKVISVRYRNGAQAIYTWNEEILRLDATVSVVPVKEFQGYQGNLFSGTTEKSARVYIDLSLELFYNSFKEFFAEHNPPYRFYVPGKRRKNSEIKDAPQGSGATIEVSRRDAWRDAAYHVYDKIKLRCDDALPRIYLGLRASNNIEDVRYPKSALLYRVTNEASMHEARKKSHIKDYLYTDQEFKQFLDQGNTL